MNKTIYFITGPTGIGKSDFAINLSKKLNGELINADSMQIYKELEIISARPRGSDIKKVQHHLYGYVSGKERFNVDKWCKDAANKVHYLLKKKSSPIFVGGTGLYIDTLINGITSIPNIPEDIKVESNNLYNKIGSEKFLKLVRELDYDSTKNILQNDTQRLKRIWEVFHFTKKKLSYWKKNENKKFLNTKKFKIILFLPPRNKNYTKVNNRVLKMIDSGAIEEVNKLLKLNYSKEQVCNVITSKLDGYYKGIVTGVDATAKTVDVKFLSHTSAAGVSTNVDYQPGGIYKFANGLLIF